MAPTVAADGTPIDVSIALAPNDKKAIPTLVNELQSGVSTLDAGGDEARHELLIKARTLVQALETPRETMIKHCWGQVSSLECHHVYAVDTYWGIDWCSRGA